MSTKRSEKTRARILDAAWDMFEEAGDLEVPMSAIAKRAEVSRQALYLHFENRTGLLVALLRHIDRRVGIEGRTHKIHLQEAPRDKLRMGMRVVAEISPLIHSAAMLLERARHGDRDARIAYDDRLRSRYEGLLGIFGALAESGELRPEWTVEQAADALMAATSIRTYHDLVAERGWTPELFERWLIQVAESLLVPPSSGG